MHVTDFLDEVEKVLDEQVRGNFPRYWNEDHITMSILKEFEEKFHSVKVEGFKREMKLLWAPYKLVGTPEKKFGDIAILVNIRFHDGDGIEGVAFLEAKKRNRNRTEFEAIEFKQLRRIFWNARGSMVLLYDYEDVTQFADIIPWMERWNGLETKPCTCSVVVPLSAVLSQKKKDTTLYKFSLPFSHQLVFRYFQGFDLDFRKTPLKIARGYAQEKGLPLYLVIASVAFGRAELQENIAFNRELYVNLR